MYAKHHLPTESELTNSLKNRSEMGFQLVYTYYSAALFGIILKIIPNKDIAEDVLQDAMIKIWNGIDSYTPAKGRLFTWMRNIIKNSAIDTLKSKQYRDRTRTDDLDINIDVLDGMESGILNTDIIGLRQLTAKLGKKYFEVLDMVYFTGHTHVETAEILGISPGIVKMRIKMAIKELRKFFDFNSELKLLPSPVNGKK